MWTNPQFPAGLVTFTEEIRNGKLLFFCAVVDTQFKLSHPMLEQLFHIPDTKLFINRSSGYPEVLDETKN